jgi:hypothetical protein
LAEGEAALLGVLDASAIIMTASAVTIKTERIANERCIRTSYSIIVDQELW